MTSLVVNPDHLNKIQEKVYVLFNVGDQNFSYPLREAIAAIDSLSKVQDKTTLVFHNIILIRATVLLRVESGSGQLFNDDRLTVWQYKGPLHFDTFMKILSHDPNISNDAWLDYMNGTRI
jgi:hypothetical protein